MTLAQQALQCRHLAFRQQSCTVFRHTDPGGNVRRRLLAIAREHHKTLYAGILEALHRGGTCFLHHIADNQRTHIRSTARHVHNRADFLDRRRVHMNRRHLARIARIDVLVIDLRMHAVTGRFRCIADAADVHRMPQRFLD